MVNRIRSKRMSAFDYINLVMMSLISVSMLYPMLNLVFVSFADIKDVVRNNGWIWFPRTFDLSGYAYVLTYAGLLKSFQVTVIITLAGTFINLILTCLGAYVLSNRDLPGRKGLMTFILITMLFNGGLIPTYIVVQRLKLIDTLWALMIPNAINTFYLIIARNFFQTIPSSMKESATIDGASEIQILVRIIMPLCLPIICTLGLFYGVAHWNEYSNAILYINNTKLHPMQVLIRSMYEVAIEELDGDRLPPPVETVRCATVVLATLPIICVYPFLQRYFTQGVMVGAVKA